MNDPAMNPVQRETEALLSGLTPAVHRIDRDHLMFEAGRASARRAGLLWLSAVTVLVGALVVSLLWRPAAEVRTVERIVEVERTPSPSESPVQPVITPGPGPLLPDRNYMVEAAAYARLCRQIIEHGPDALPRSSGSSGSPEPAPTVEELLQNL